MKILHLSSEQTWRGGEQQIAYLLEETEKRGIQPIVACKQGSAFEIYVRSKGWQYFALPFKNSMDLRTAWNIKRICKEHKIDIIHLHSSKAHSIAVWSVVLGNSSKLVLSRRVDFPLKDNLFSRWKYNHTSIQKIICVSDKIKHIVEEGVQDKDKCITIHSGIALGKFALQGKLNYFHSHYKIPPASPIIGNTSALADHKDYFTFINTAEILINQNNDLRFLIIGDGPLRSEIVSYVASKRLENHIVFTGFITNLAQTLHEIDIFLMTSKTEGLGTSILDAFASKVPVVATNAGGIPELVKHEETGLIAPVKDHEKLAENVNRILNEPELKERLIINAYDFVQGFSKEKTAERTLAVYREILADKS